MSEKKVQTGKTGKVKKDLKSGAGLGQLTLTLCAISAICALLLALTNMVTAPIIEANAEAKKTAAIAAEVLPGFTGTLTQVNYTGSDATVKSLQKGSEGSFVVEVSPKTSFSGNLTLLVGIDPNRVVTGISVVASGETEGFGARASEPAWRAQFAGKSGSVALTKNGGEIEGIAGATLTSTGVCEAVNSALTAIDFASDGPFDPSLVPDEPDPTDDVDVLSVEENGEGYVVTVDCGTLSFSKTLKIQVNIGTDKKVAGVAILETGETAGYGALASEPDFIDQFLGVSGTVNLTTKDGEIESISGASTTSNAICVGVTAALQIVDHPDQWPQGTEVPTEPETDGSGVSVEESGEGYLVTVDCGPDSFSKTLKIQVSIGVDKTVTGVTILETGETAGYGLLASEPDFIDQFVGVSGTVALTKNGGEIESISGASTTSNAICVGVTAALNAVETLG